MGGEKKRKKAGEETGDGIQNSLINYVKKSFENSCITNLLIFCVAEI